MILTMQKVYVRAYSGRFSPAKQMFEKACKFVLCMIEYHKRTHVPVSWHRYWEQQEVRAGC